MSTLEPGPGDPRRGQLVCRSCSAIPDDDAVTGGRCPWCRGQLSREFGVVVARCVECGTRGILGADLGTRDYAKGSFTVPRAICLVHYGVEAPSGGAGPVTRATSA